MWTGNGSRLCVFSTPQEPCDQFWRWLHIMFLIYDINILKQFSKIRFTTRLFWEQGFFLPFAIASTIPAGFSGLTIALHSSLGFLRLGQVKKVCSDKTSTAALSLIQYMEQVGSRTSMTMPSRSRHGLVSYEFRSQVLGLIVSSMHRSCPATALTLLYSLPA